MRLWVYSAFDVVRVFSTRAKATAWIKKNDPGAVPFECEVDDASPLRD